MASKPRQRVVVIGNGMVGFKFCELVTESRNGDRFEIVSFGEDAAGNLYLVDLNGEIFRVSGPPPAVPSMTPAVTGLLALAILFAGALMARGIGGPPRPRSARYRPR